jgi:hypothetical protein
MTQDGRFFVLGGGIDGIDVLSLPAFVPLISVVACVYFPANECPRDCDFRARISRPDGTDLGVEGKTPLKARIPAQTPGFGPNLKVAIGVAGLIFHERGRFSFNFFVDDRPIGRLEFNVGEPVPRDAPQGK